LVLSGRHPYKAIVRIGPQVTGTSVELAEVSLKPLSGELVLRGLNIGNPEGFVAPHVFALVGIDLAIDMDTVNEPVLVKSILNKNLSCRRSVYKSKLYVTANEVIRQRLKNEYPS